MDFFLGKKQKTHEIQKHIYSYVNAVVFSREIMENMELGIPLHDNYVEDTFPKLKCYKN